MTYSKTMTIQKEIYEIAIKHSVNHWRFIQKTNITDWKTLISYLQLNPEQAAQVLNYSNFALNLPLRLAEKIAKKTLDDPLFRQFVPTVEEQKNLQGFVKDPVGDEKKRKSEKLLHKYEGRALLICSGGCAMHCRYCFRQNFSYETQRKGFSQELELIRQDTSLKEIILSGGDPLSLSNEHLKLLLDELSLIPHVKRIRFHSRFLIGIPERIDNQLLKIFKDSKKQIIFIIHCNHPLELDADVIHSVKAIQYLGIPTLSQSVLLKGVNDSFEVLKALFEALSDYGILPYYLYQLDKVQGSAHFEVQEALGLELMRQLIQSISGYAVPRYVKEIPGEPSKTPII